MGTDHLGVTAGGSPSRAGVNPRLRGYAAVIPSHMHHMGTGRGSLHARMPAAQSALAASGEQLLAFRIAGMLLEERQDALQCRLGSPFKWLLDELVA